MLPRIKNNHFFLISFGICLTLLVGLEFSAIYRLWSVNTPVIIHFDVYKGIDVLGTKAELFLTIAGAFCLVLLNACLTDALFERDRFLSYLVAFFNMAFTCLIFIAVSVILGTN